VLRKGAAEATAREWRATGLDARCDLKWWHAERPRLGSRSGRGGENRSDCAARDKQRESREDAAMSMITSSLKRRLQRLEDWIPPASKEANVLLVQFLDPKQQVVHEKRITLPPVSAAARRRRW
jgi:hypothetical protein